MRISNALSLMVVFATCSVSLAQNRREERREERAAPVAVRGEAADAGRGSADQQIAACLHGANRNEIELSRLAQEKASNEAVRDFAAMMVKDHSPVLQKLQTVAGNLVTAQPQETPAATERRRGEGEERREPARREPAVKPESEAPAAAPGATRAPAGVAPEGRVVARVAGNGLDWVAIHKQVADQCLASTKAEFQKKEGAEFDQCYMGHAIMAHQKVLDEIKVLRNYASAELRQDLDKSAQMATHHLEEAKKIAESLKGETKSVSRKPKAE
jgi:predicted outer membrane protein